MKEVTQDHLDILELRIKAIEMQAKRMRATFLQDMQKLDAQRVKALKAWQAELKREDAA